MISLKRMEALSSLLLCAPLLSLGPCSRKHSGCSTYVEEGSKPTNFIQNLLVPTSARQVLKVHLALLQVFKSTQVAEHALTFGVEAKAPSDRPTGL